MTWSGWGGNSDGVAGLGDTSPHTSGPVAQPIGIEWTQISANGYHVAALDSSGNLWVWGSNNFYALGTGEAQTAVHGTPVQITQTGISNILEVACTARGTFARRNDGTIYFAGTNSGGEMGEGATGAQHTTYVALTNWSAYSVSKMIQGGSALAILTTGGSLYFSGTNNNGEAGDGSAAGTVHTTPVQWGSFTDITQASLSTSIMFVARSNTQVWASGDNSFGACATGTAGGNKLTPVQSTTMPSSPTFTKVLDGTTYAIDSSGHVWVAGLNFDGELNNGGDALHHPTATDLTGGIGPGTLTFSKVIGPPASEDNYTLLTTDGQMWAIGANTLADGAEIDNSGTDKFFYTRVWSITGVVDAVSCGGAEGVYMARVAAKGRSYVYCVGV